MVWHCSLSRSIQYYWQYCPCNGLWYQMMTTHGAVMFSFTSFFLLSLKQGAIYFGSAKRDRDLILFLCSSFSVSSLVPRDYGNIFVNNLGKWLRRERPIFPSQPLPVRALRSFPYPHTRFSLVSSSRSRLSLREAGAGRSFRFRGWVCDHTKAGRE